MQSNFQLHDYQIIAKNFILSHPKCGLFLDVGFGKTLITLAALKELGEHGCIQGHILIIAPKAVAINTWSDEMTKWGMNVEQVSLIMNDKGKQLTRQQRLQRYDEIATHRPAIYFINRELIDDLVKYHKENKKPWAFPTVVIDELHSFKAHNTNRFKAMRSVNNEITRLIGLTGTPQPNGLMDLWSLIYLMDNGQRLGSKITDYRETYFNPGMLVDGHPVTWNPKPFAADVIYDKIKDIVMSIKNPNLKLPDITYNDVYCYMSPSEMKTYKDFIREKIYICKDNDGNEKTATAVNSGVLANRLLQMASGTIYVTDDESDANPANKEKEYALIHKAKLAALDYIINNTTSPIIVAYHFHSDLKEISSFLESKDIPVRIYDKSPEMTADWNNGKYPVMLIQPKSSGMGVNLQKGGHTLVWYTLPTSLEDYIQTNGRLYRQGQQYPVVIHRLVTKNTIDEKQVTNINNKNMNEQALMDAVSVALSFCQD